MSLPRYEDLPLKKYYVVRFNFNKGFSRYEVFEYESKKKKTIKQLWQLVYSDENAFIYSGESKHIMEFWDIIEKYNLPENRCERLTSFNYI